MAAPRLTAGMVTTTYVNSLAQYVDDVRTGVIARGRRTTTSSSTTTEVGVLRIDGIPMRGGWLYRVSTSPLHLNGTVVGDTMATRIRYDTTGAAATVSSTFLPGSRYLQYEAVGAAQAESGMTSATYTPPTDQTVSLLLTVGRIAGTGTIAIYADATDIIEMVVEVFGVDPGDTGVDI